MVSNRERNNVSLNSKMNKWKIGFTLSFLSSCSAFNFSLSSVLNDGPETLADSLGELDLTGAKV